VKGSLEEVEWMLCPPRVDGETADDVLWPRGILRHWTMLFGAVRRWVSRIDDNEKKRIIVVYNKHTPKKPV